MFDFFLKILMYPGVILIANAIVPVKISSNPWHIFAAGLFLAWAGYLMDKALLISMGAGAGAFIDTAVLSCVLVIYGLIFDGITVTLPGILIAGGLLGMGEYLTHRIILGDTAF